MARFVVTRQLGGLPVSVTWSDGELAGSPSVLAEVARSSTSARRSRPPRPAPYTAALEPDYVAVATIAEALDRVDEVDGEVSRDPRAELPPGAKG